MFRNLSVSFFCLLTPVSFCGVKRIFHLSFGQLSLGGIAAQIVHVASVATMTMQPVFWIPALEGTIIEGVGLMDRIKRDKRGAFRAKTAALPDA